MSSRIKLILLLIGLCTWQIAGAQRPDAAPEAPDTTARKGILEEVVDTVYAPQTYVIATDFYHSRPERVDSLSEYLHQYDKIRRERINHAHLGNLGSPQRSRLYKPVLSKGLALGQHQFDLYRRDFSNFRYYDSETPISEFYYSQGFRQTDATFSALFAKNFANGIKASVEYNRINQFGQFQLQRVKNTTLGVGIWYDSPKGKYDGLFHYASNSFVQQDNGGISDYKQLDTIPQRDIAFINLGDALTTHRERAFSVQNHFHVVGANDSTSNPVLIDIIHTGQFRWGFIKFSDDDLIDDAEYYGDFIVDDRGVRQFINYNTLDNRVDLQFRYGRPTEYDISKHTLRAGIQYRTTLLQQEPNSERINEVFLNASGRLTILPQLDLIGRGYLELAGQAGDFLIDAQLRFKLPREIGVLSGGLLAHARSPNVIEKKLYVTQTEKWSTDFNKPTHTELNFTIDIPRWQLFGKASFIGLSNLIYYDSERMPMQLTSTIGIVQVLVGKEIRIGNFGVVGSVAWQNVPQELRLPSVIGKAQIYFTDKWFRNNLKVRFGADLRITDEHDGVNYFPLTGQFHIDNSRRIAAYPALDGFLDFEVRETFRAFVKFENFSAWFVDGPYMHVVDYPQFDQYFRFGFWLKLFN